MNSNARPALVAVGGTALMLAATAVLAAPTAFAAAPESLAVYFAGSSAAPVGITSRVPAETVGGLLLSSSIVQLGKAQATAAGGSLGPLGDAFVVTSAPPGTLNGFPSVVTAQDPPSETAPRRAELSGGSGGGAPLGQIRNVDLNAWASDFPEASSEASGNALLSGVLSTGAAISRSTSTVLPDGTVLTEGFTAVQDVVIGSAPTQLRIASVDTTASITAKPGSKAVPLLETHFSGAELAGVPVVIDGNGVRIADQAAAPAASVATLSAALQGLAAQGITVLVRPSSNSPGQDGAQVAGAALSIRYVLPASPIPRPSDIGTDETFDVGSAAATLTARTRQALGGQALRGQALGGQAPGVAAAGGTTAAAAAPTTTAPVPPSLPILAGPPPAGPGSAEADAARSPAAEDAPLQSVAFGQLRRAGLQTAKFRDDYRGVLLAAALGFSCLVAVFRKRPLH